MNSTEMTKASITDLSSLTDDARIWVFQSSIPLQGEVRTAVSSAMMRFLKDWAAHGKSLFAAFEIVYDRFIVVGVNEAMAQATGCSIDSLMRHMQGIDREHRGLDLLNRMKVAYRSGEEIMECDVNSFATMLANGEAVGSTVVFNNVVNTLGEFKTVWETTVAASWHANLLP